MYPGRPRCCWQTVDTKRSLFLGFSQGAAFTARSVWSSLDVCGARSMSALSKGRSPAVPNVFSGDYPSPFAMVRPLTHINSGGSWLVAAILRLETPAKWWSIFFCRWKGQAVEGKVDTLHRSTIFGVALAERKICLYSTLCCTGFVATFVVLCLLDLFICALR